MSALLAGGRLDVLSGEAARDALSHQRTELLADRLAPYLGPGLLTLEGPAAVPASPEDIATALQKRVPVPGRIRGNMWAVAQYIESHRHRRTLKKLMADVFAVEPTPSAFHRFLAGLPMRWFVGAGLAGAAIAPLAFFTLLHDYQRKRVLTFLNPEEDMLGSGYHITQSKIAIGSGGFWGKGFGNGSQSHLDYLPEAHTDFAFATMAEEWGIVGALFVLAVFLWVFRWGLQVARNAPDRFSSLLAAGMTFTIFFYMAVNIMMVTGMAPVVGIPLPWISHGGSAMMTNMACLGAIMAVDRWSRRGGLRRD